ncbi:MULTISPECIES: AI-2E family transporter [unclassified Coleofasciculus]|uniref:AI-2E family transporter n=1 Tax=unclassified Coleofasciculus TaxID=2692782 RepID=UPI001881724C|nr:MULTISPECIES: AI-2E family transporter [unclassified Coleofasciculus]MBE9127512.1 AI-2E family transporter [Coleofasciculus sp. LEGE 07081]MBE9150826.1 AI-2E family transporter [Coleofasciculus sp. LEGE 07092]
MSLGKLIGFLAFAVSLYILWRLKQILLLIFAAVVFAVVLNRVVGWLQRQGAKRGIAIALTLITLLGILTLLLGLIGPSFAQQVEQLGNLVPTIFESLRGWFNQVQTRLPEQLINIGSIGDIFPKIQPFATRLLNNAYTWFSDLLTIFLQVFLVLVLILMLVANPSAYRRGLILLFPGFYRRRADEILSECEDTLVGWMTATLIDMAVISVVTFIGLSILNVPLALANAVLAGLLEFIPNIGPTLSVFPPLAVALLDGPWWKGIAVIGLYVIIQQFEAYILVPYVMKKQVDLLPAVTLIAVVVFGSLFGFLGVFLSVPLVIIFKIWINELLIKDILNTWQKNDQDYFKQDSQQTDGEESKGSQQS